MKKSDEILRKKASKVDPLRESIKEEPETRGEVIHKTIVNEKGNKIKVFEDPLYSREKRSTVNYSVFRGKWEFENIDEIDGLEEHCAVKFYPVKDESSFIIAFKSVKDRVEFFDSIYSDNQMKQRGSGMNLEKLANSRVLQTTGGLISLSVLGYGLYRLFRKKQ
jgi:plasmid replication initiation protein